MKSKITSKTSSSSWWGHLHVPHQEGVEVFEWYLFLPWFLIRNVVKISKTTSKINPISLLLRTLKCPFPCPSAPSLSFWSTVDSDISTTVHVPCHSSQTHLSYYVAAMSVTFPGAHRNTNSLWNLRWLDGSQLLFEYLNWPVKVTVLRYIMKRVATSTNSKDIFDID